MSAPNFKTMRDFPLIARNDSIFMVEDKRCPECGCLMDADATECDMCGCTDLEDYAYFDEIAFREDFREIEDELEELNRDLLFHKISLKSGYYSGTQFYVEAEHDLDAEDYDNDDCHYYFDCCRSVAYRKYAAEKRKIARLLHDLGRRYGFEEFLCVTRFSNGEAFYAPVSSPRARLLNAVA